MTSSVRILSFLCALAALSYACAGEGDDDDDGATSPTPAPTPGAASKSFTLNGSGFQVAHIGETAFVRVISSSGAAVVFCEQSAPITNGGVFTVSSFPAAVLATNRGYFVELFANVNGGTAVFESSAANPDHIYRIESDELDDVQSDVVMDFPHGVQTPPSEFTWAPGTGCPGVP